MSGQQRDVAIKIVRSQEELGLRDDDPEGGVSYKDVLRSMRLEMDIMEVFLQAYTRCIHTPRALAPPAPRTSTHALGALHALATPGRLATLCACWLSLAPWRLQPFKAGGLQIRQGCVRGGFFFERISVYKHLQTCRTWLL